MNTNAKAMEAARAINAKAFTLRREVPLAVYEVLHSQGQPLTSTVRDFLEPRFGYNFSNVRIHADRQAAEAAQQVHSRAFTVGRDVVFGAGEYAPGTAAGRRLLTHELVHVIQQESGGGESAVRLRPGGTSIQRAEPERPPTEASESELAADVDALEAITAIEGDYSTLFEQLQIVQAEALAQSINWQSMFRVVGAAFADAMELHEDAVQEAQQQAEDRADVVSAVVAVVAVGLLAYGSTIVQGSKELATSTQALVNALEDAAQQALESTSQAASEAMLTDHLDSVTSEVPQSFQNYFLNEVGRAHQEILGWLIDVMKLISSQRQITRGNLLDDGSPSKVQLETETLSETKTAVNSLLAEVRRTDLFGTPPEVDGYELQNEIERGTWARWIPDKLQDIKVVTATAPPGTSGKVMVPTRQERVTFYGLEDAIRERLVALEISQEAGVADLNVLQKLLTSGEVQGLIRWAQAYSPVVKIPGPPKPSSDKAE
jgi:hypothetical protein